MEVQVHLFYLPGSGLIIHFSMINLSFVNALNLVQSKNKLLFGQGLTHYQTIKF